MNYIKQLIAKNQLDLAMEELLHRSQKIVPSKLCNDVVLLSLTWHHFQLFATRGCFSWEEENRHRLNLAQRMLKILDCFD